MRVLHVTHQYKPAIGGSERYFADVSEELALRGHEIHVATTRSRHIQTWRNELLGRERINNVDIRRFRSFERSWLGWRTLALGNAGLRRTHSPLFEPMVVFGTGPVAPGLAWYILRHSSKYDLVHLQTLPFAHAIYGYFLARANKRPIVITPHIHVEQSETFDLAAFRAVLRGADVVLAASEREVSYLRERGVREDRIVVGGNGVQPSQLPRIDRATARERLGLPQNAFIVLYLGRKEPYKGLPMLVEALRLLQTRYPQVHLVSAGPRTPQCAELLADYGDLPGWTDMDEIDDSTKLDLLNACDALALPSTGEAFGIVFLEAWTVAKPVIGARAGAIPWVIQDGHDGLLVDPRNPADLAAKIAQLADSPNLCARLAANGESKVHQRFTVTRIADRVEDAYKQAIGLAGVGAALR